MSTITGVTFPVLTPHALVLQRQKDRLHLSSNLRPRRRPVSLAGMVADILVLRLKPARLQHGVDVVVPERVLTPVQKICKVLKGQVPPVAEEEDCRLDNLPRRIP